MRCEEQKPAQVSPWQKLREQMVQQDIVKRGIRDERVLAAMAKVPRHEFVPVDFRERAYGDHPLPIGSGQTISQPYIVALMSEALAVRRGDKVLEIGTGSGYQAAVLAELTDKVYSIEIVPELGRRASRTLQELGYGGVQLRVADGYLGWPEAAPFDRILLTAAPEKIPRPLVDQLAMNGILLAPVGKERRVQRLMRVRKTKTGLQREVLSSVIFVPMTGKAQKQ
jgi:protein-L-isoaspartate(D-aspartate) O-methyltransferase